MIVRAGRAAPLGAPARSARRSGLPGLTPHGSGH